MWTLNNIENSAESLLEAYTTTFALPFVGKREEKIMAVAILLEQAQMLHVRDAVLVREPLFVQFYTQADQKTIITLQNLFRNLEEQLLTRVEAAALLCLQSKAEPFASYLAQTLSLAVVKRLCSSTNRPSVIRHWEDWQVVIIQSLLAARTRNAQLLRDLDNVFFALSAKSGDLAFVPELQTVSLVEQMENWTAFLLRLNAVYPYSVTLEHVNLNVADLNLALERKQEQWSTVFDYLAKNQNDAVYARVERKLMHMCRVLDEAEIVIRNLSLRALRVDIYENIWLVALQGSYLMKKGMVVRDINKDTGRGTWDAELYTAGLRTFRSGYQPDVYVDNEGDVVSDVEESGLDVEIGEDRDIEF